MITKKCVECDKEFISYHKRTVACSPECKKKRKNKQLKKYNRVDKKPIELRICRECGKKFIPKQINMVYCNDDGKKTCYKKVNYRMIKERLKGIRNNHKEAPKPIPVDDEREALTIRRIQSEMSVDKFCAMASKILRHKARVIGLRGGGK